MRRKRPKFKIYTTIEDISLPLFFTDIFLQKYEVHAEVYENGESSKTEFFDYIYLRDPFNSALSSDEIKNTTISILEKHNDSIFIDKISSLDDIYFEKKSRQYNLYKKFMPSTRIFRKDDIFDAEKKFYKHNLSSRARGIYFSRSQIPEDEIDLGNVIEQVKINIEYEYRVIVVRGQILNKVILKSSKSERTQVKALRAVEIDKDLKEFTEAVIENSHHDLIGLDIAKEKEGGYKLIEVNRSPQFKRYYMLTKVNPLEFLTY
jgi:glutathione synthase/RimK-type ligase-like ATP-grasp enzyme